MLPLLSAVNILWIFICIFLCVTSVLWWYFLKINSYWNDRGIPDDNPLPLIGNLTFLMRKSSWDFFDELRQRHPRDYVGIFLGWQPSLVVQTPELARDILVKNSDYFQDRFIYATDSTDPLGSLNLFTVKNPIWTQMRHEISPMFTSARLKLLTELMNINAKELVQRIQKDIEKKKLINLKELFTMYTSDTVGYTVFGLRVSALSGHDSPLWTIAREMVKWNFWRGFEFTMFFFMPVIAQLLRSKFFSPSATQYVKQLFWNVVKQRENSTNNNNKDLVNHLLKLKENLKLPADAGSELADNLMLAQVAVFILGSIETSSSTLSYCLHELAHHPQVQEKLYEEVNEAVTRSGKEVLEYNTLVELKYLSACLYETLRKYPPVPYLDRVCSRPYKINGDDDVKLEAGIPVMVNVVAIHKNPKYWPEPDRWDPDRPCPTSDNDNMGYTFLAFGEGPRFCIGKRYGMMQMRAALAQIIHNFRMEPGSVPYEVASDPYSVLLSPKNGGCVKFIPRW